MATTYAHQFDIWYLGASWERKSRNTSAVMIKSTAKKVDMLLANNWLNNSRRSRPFSTRNEEVVRQNKAYYGQ